MLQSTELGRTGLRLPVLALGTAANTSAQDVRQALDLGYVLVDTAESYGSEPAVGAAIAQRREAALVATKVSHHRLAYRDVLAAADESLRRLNLAHIDLYQVHWPNPAIPLEETMGAFARLVDDGKVRFIGVCNFDVADLRRAQAALGKHRIVSNQVSLSLNHRTACGELAGYCREQGITLLAYSPLAGDPRKILEKDREGIVTAMATRLQKTPAQVLLNWVVSQGNAIALARSSSPDHLKANIEATGWRLSDEDQRTLERAIPFRARSRLEMAARRLAWRIVREVRTWRAGRA